MSETQIHMVLVLLILRLHLVQVLARHLSGSIDGLARTVLGRIDAAEHEDKQGIFAIICQCQMIQTLLAQSCAGIFMIIWWSQLHGRT